MVRGVATAVLLVLVLLLGLGWALQRRLVYFPSTADVPEAATVLPGARDVDLRTSDGLTLGAWHLPPRDRDGVTVLVANGNAGDRSLRAPLARRLAAQGLGVLLFDYRGFGGNEGSPTEEGLARDVRAARAYLVDEAGVAPERLVYLGESLGAAVVTELATEHPPAGMVLRSPFVDLASVGSVHYPFLPVGLLLRDRFPLAEHVAGVDVPVAVVYGSRDSVVPPEQSRAVANTVPDPADVVEVPGADHNDPELVAGRVLVSVVADLADQVTGGGRS
jgi:pimeloyl-ACP methyl ester carboxylesterase